MKVFVELKRDSIPHSFKLKDDWGITKEYDSFQIKESSGKRLYITAIKNGMRMTTFCKNMVFEAEKVFISFGKKRIEIGSYKEVSA